MNEGEIEPMGKDDDDIEEVNDDVAGEYERRNSLPDGDDDFLPPLTLMTQQRSVTYGDLVDGNNQRVSYISEVRLDLDCDNLFKMFSLCSGSDGRLEFPRKNPRGVGVFGEHDFLSQGEDASKMFLMPSLILTMDRWSSF